MSSLGFWVDGHYVLWDVDMGDTGSFAGFLSESEFLRDAAYRISDDRFTIEYSDEDGRRWRVTYRITPIVVD